MEWLIFWRSLGHLVRRRDKFATLRIANSGMIFSSKFQPVNNGRPLFGHHLLIPAARYSLQSGDTSTRGDRHAEQTKRFSRGMVGNGVSGPSPIASKLTGVDRRHTGLQHVTQAPARPRA